MDLLLKRVCDFIVDEGTTNTSSGNWIISFDEIQEKTNVSPEWFYSNIGNIDDALTFIPEVSDVIIDFGEETFDVDFYLDYCGNIEN